jgi:hypothetical protein
MLHCWPFDELLFGCFLLLSAKGVGGKKDGLLHALVGFFVCLFCWWCLLVDLGEKKKQTNQKIWNCKMSWCSLAVVVVLLLSVTAIESLGIRSNIGCLLSFFSLRILILQKILCDFEKKKKAIKCTAGMIWESGNRDF